MGCGSSGHVVPAAEEASNSHGKAANGLRPNGRHDSEHDDLPTVVLPETPVRPKPLLRSPPVDPLQNFRSRDFLRASSGSPPATEETDGDNWNQAIAFEIPLEEIDGNRRESNTPPPHLQRLLQPPQADISLPDIEEKLAEAEQRRMSILQQRAASAQKRSQRMMKALHGMSRVDADHDRSDANKYGPAAVTIPPEPGVCEDKYIT